MREERERLHRVGQHVGALVGRGAVGVDDEGTVRACHLFEDSL
jgi:hypothetical protein